MNSYTHPQIAQLVPIWRDLVFVPTQKTKNEKTKRVISLPAHLKKLFLII